jgi:hypothetical protein
MLNWRCQNGLFKATVKALCSARNAECALKAIRNGENFAGFGFLCHAGFPQCPARMKRSRDKLLSIRI